MKYRACVKGEWYAYLRNDGAGVYGKHMIKSSYINTLNGQPFFNNRMCEVSNIDYHSSILPMTDIEHEWFQYCQRTRGAIPLTTFKANRRVIDDYSII